MILTGKTALITGGGTGMGAGIARRFVSEGAKVCLAGIVEEDLDKMLEELPAGQASKCFGDVSKEEDAASMVEETLKLGDGRIDILVNSAGIAGRGSITEISLETWERMFAVNLKGPFFLMRAAIPHMIESGGGSIINISSLAGLRCVTDNTAYCTSKAALITLTQQAAMDYGPHGIRCNVICPGFVLTPMTMEGGLNKLAKAAGSDIETVASEAFKDIPMRKPATPEDISGMCSFLASDDSSYITGLVLPLDGGISIVDHYFANFTRLVHKKD